MVLSPKGGKCQDMCNNGMYKQVWINLEMDDPMDVYRGKASTLAALLWVRPLKFWDMDREPHMCHLGSQSCSTAAWVYIYGVEMWPPCSSCKCRYRLFITCVMLATAGALLFRVICAGCMFNTSGVRCSLYMVRNVPRRELTVSWSAYIGTDTLSVHSVVNKSCFSCGASQTPSKAPHKTPAPIVVLDDKLLKRTTHKDPCTSSKGGELWGIDSISMHLSKADPISNTSRCWRSHPLASLEPILWKQPSLHSNRWRRTDIWPITATIYHQHLTLSACYRTPWHPLYSTISWVWFKPIVSWLGSITWQVTAWRSWRTSSSLVQTCRQTIYSNSCLGRASHARSTSLYFSTSPTAAEARKAGTI